MAYEAPFDPFATLGLSRDAPPAAIKSRYRELARRYHPNRHQGSEESKATLAEHFHLIHQAWTHLKVPDKRRRYAELLELAEDQDALLVRMADLLNQTQQHKPRPDAQLSTTDGHVSSDADDDDLPRIAKLQRRTTLQRTMTGTQHLGDEPQDTSAAARWRVLQRRIRSNKLDVAPITVCTKEPEADNIDYFSLRRKKLEKLKRKEMSAFVRYRDAMVQKFEAELEAESQRELYERAMWKREYFERAPRETAERLRSFQHALSAVRAFGHPAPRRRNRSTVSYAGQILSTGDAYEIGQLLDAENASSPSQTRPLHRRGWSSDISGDQESSDENSSGPPTPRPGSPMPGHLHHRHHSQQLSLEALRLLVTPHTNGISDSSVADHGPFKMIVKRPTGLEEKIEVHDSSPESGSGTSRSPSPNPAHRSISAFTISLPSHFADFLGMRHTSDHSSPPKTAASVNGDIARSPGATQDSCSFFIETVTKAEHHHVLFDNVHLLTMGEKSRLLGTTPDAEADPAELMERLYRLDVNVARNFEIKADIMESFNFRLIHNHHEVVKGQHHSFIALSYRRRIHVEKKHNHFTLPLEAELFQAVWAERLSDSEGLWIDQICIDQDSDREKTISMSAMDMVYRSARLVVVVLDDIALNSHEGEILENHMKEYASLTHVAPTKRFRQKQPPYLEDHDGLYQILRKILRSSWFVRAWCRHEMKLARDHIFLIPFKSPGTWSGMKVIRFTGQCLTHLLALTTEVPFEDSIELVKPALHAFFRDRSKLPAHERHLHSHHGNFTTVVAEVFAMETGGDPRIPARQRAADALKDKIAIILNTMECGLALTPQIRDPQAMLSKADCHYMLMLLALAAQDPGALASVGPPMRLTMSDAPTPHASSTWLFEPTNVDAGLNNYRTLNRLPADVWISTRTELDEHYVELDLKIIPRGKAMRGYDDHDHFELARQMVTFCNSKKLGRNRKRYLVADVAANRHFGVMHDVYVETLACVLACGPDWMDDICHRYGVARTKQDLQGAYELLIALKNTAGRWPEHAWSERSVGFIMDFVNFLIIRGMPQRQILHREEWRPVWVATPSGGKVLTFTPPGKVQPAVPIALLDPDYLHLARLWVLEPRESHFDGQKHRDWTLLGKSVLFSDETAVQQLQSDNGNWKRQQRVFGREDPHIQRLLRERSLHV